MGLNAPFSTQPVLEKTDASRSVATSEEIAQAFDTLINSPISGEIAVITGIAPWICELKNITRLLLQNVIDLAKNYKSIGFWPGKHEGDVVSKQIPTRKTVFANEHAFRCLARVRGSEQITQVLYSHEPVTVMGFARNHHVRSKRDSVRKVTSAETSILTRPCTITISGFPEDCAERNPICILSGTVDPKENSKLDNISLTIFEQSNELPIGIIRKYTLSQGVAVLNELTVCSSGRIRCSKSSKQLAFLEPQSISIYDYFAQKSTGSLRLQETVSIRSASITEHNEGIIFGTDYTESADMISGLTLTYEKLAADEFTTQKQTFNIPLRFAYNRMTIHHLTKFDEWANAGSEQLLASIHGVIDNAGFVC